MKTSKTFQHKKSCVCDTGALDFIPFLFPYSSLLVAEGILVLLSRSSPILCTWQGPGHEIAVYKE
jgi:hypothetical protein